MAAIQTINLTKDFKSRRAVDALSLSVDEGEVFALLGANGAGKTTVIKMLCCLLMPTSGDALILGNSILTEPGAVKRTINLSPQETAVALKLSVAENLELMARLYGETKTEARLSAKLMMAALHLSDRANDRSKSLSGGMQRRLSVAMALISRPRVVFLDEPTLGLDVGTRRALWRALNDIKGDTTIILTTHYLEEAQAHADRIGIMRDGRLVALGTAAELQLTAGVDTLEDAFLALTGTGDER
ncbi:MAG: ABC transporter A family member [Antricoccus sp.]